MTRVTLLAVGLAFIALPAYGQNSSYTLVQCDQGKSLQAAIDNTREGGTIEITGTCNETVKIRTDKIFLRGAGGAVKGVPGTLAAIKVTDGATGVKITGLSLSGDSGVSVDKGSSASIWENVIAATNNVGVLVGAGSYAEVLNNEISSGGFGGVFVFNGSAARVFYNNVTSLGSAVGIEGGSSAEVGSNVLRSSDKGLSVVENSYVFLPGTEPNTLSNNHYGTYCEFGGVIRVDTNQIFLGNTINVTSSTCEVRILGGGVAFP